MKREKKLTKKERKAQTVAEAPPAAGGGGHVHGHEHIHCVACGRHLDDDEFEEPLRATMVTCAHGSAFASCVACVPKSKEILAEHDRTGKPVKSAAAWH